MITGVPLETRRLLSWRGKPAPPQLGLLWEVRFLDGDHCSWISQRISACFFVVNQITGTKLEGTYHFRPKFMTNTDGYSWGSRTSKYFLSLFPDSMFVIWSWIRRRKRRFKMSKYGRTFSSVLYVNTSREIAGKTHTFRFDWGPAGERLAVGIRSSCTGLSHIHRKWHAPSLQLYVREIDTSWGTRLLASTDFV